MTQGEAGRTPESRGGVGKDGAALCALEHALSLVSRARAGRCAGLRPPASPKRTATFTAALPLSPEQPATSGHPVEPQVSRGSLLHPPPTLPGPLPVLPSAAAGGPAGTESTETASGAEGGWNSFYCSVLSLIVVADGGFDVL